MAHPHTMYATSPMYVTSSATGVTMSHPSQLLTTFPPPPLFANNPINNLINNPAIQPACFAEMVSFSKKKKILPHKKEENTKKKHSFKV